jgi:hypothetical protein
VTIAQELKFVVMNVSGSGKEVRYFARVSKVVEVEETELVRL